MIAKSGMGKGFSGLMNYLSDDKKMDWMESRNVASFTPESIAKEMQIYSMKSRAKKPVYHVSISWDKNDKVTRDQMIEVGDRFLNHMNLKDHQAVMVAHKDGDHPHLHLMINRVHPETEKAWENFEYSGQGRGRKIAKGEYKRREEFFRKIEKEFGWREVPGKHTEHGKDMNFDDPAPEVWEIRRANDLKEKAASMGFDPARIDHRSPKQKAIEIKDSLFKAKSFGELDGVLAKQGLWIETKGQGGVITDGYLSAKLSSVSRELSAGKLEKKFGENLISYIQFRDKGIDLEVGQEMVKHSLQLKFKTELENAENITRGMMKKISNDLLLFEKNSGAVNIKAELEISFNRAFVDGKKAYEKFVRNSTNVGISQAYDDISIKPERFGRVKNQTELNTITDHLRSYIQKNEQAKGHIDEWLKNYYKHKLKSKQQHFRSAYLNIAKQNPGKTINKFFTNSLSSSEAGRDLLKLKHNSDRGIQAVREVISFHKAFQQSVAAGGTKLGKSILKTIGGPKTAIAMKVMESSSQLLLKAARSKELSR